MTPFNKLQVHDKFYIDSVLCFKLDEERYISPHGTHRIGDKKTRVQTSTKLTKKPPFFRREEDQDGINSR